MNNNNESSITRRKGRLRKLAMLATCSITATLALSLAACQPKAPPAASEDNQLPEIMKSYDLQTNRETFDDPAALEDYVAKRAERDENSKTLYKATVETLDDGTQVQRVPNDPRGYNVGIIKAEERGCTSCHSLENAIEWCPISHNGLNSYGDDPIDVTTCIACHDGQQKPLFGRSGLEMSSVIHNSHLNSDNFTEKNGNCLSCHYLEPGTGDMPLWDEVKYDVMQGFKTVSDLQGAFSFDQNVLTDNDKAFYQLSASTDPNGIALHSSSDNSVLEERVVAVNGLVNTPIDLKLVDVPAEQLETRIMKMNCSANGVGDAFIANAEITGIPFKTIVEMAGVTGDAVTLVCEEGKSTFKIDWLIEKNAILAFKMNGENLPSELGYPCTMFTEATGASSSRRYITGLEFTDSTKVSKWKNDVPGTLIPGQDDTYFNKPVGAFLNVQDGQIFTGTSSVTFEGYVDGFNEKVTEVSFSLDRGKTWQTCDTSSSTLDRWIYWTYQIDGLEPGSYNLRMRVVTETGRVIPQDVNTVFHLQ